MKINERILLLLNPSLIQAVDLQEDRKSFKKTEKCLH